MFNFIIPCRRRGGLEGESVGVKENAEGLNPCVVSGSAGRAEANEAALIWRLRSETKLKCSFLLPWK